VAERDGAGEALGRVTALLGDEAGRGAGWDTALREKLGEDGRDTAALDGMLIRGADRLIDGADRPIDGADRANDRLGEPPRLEAKAREGAADLDGARKPPPAERGTPPLPPPRGAAIALAATAVQQNVTTAHNAGFRFLANMA
jgi:hypothetical protein